MTSESRAYATPRKTVTGWAYGHNPEPYKQVRDCGCEDCTDWFLDNPHIATEPASGDEAGR